MPRTREAADLAANSAKFAAVKATLFSLLSKLSKLAANSNTSWNFSAVKVLASLRSRYLIASVISLLARKVLLSTACLRVAAIANATASSAESKPPLSK